MAKHFSKNQKPQHNKKVTGVFGSRNIVGRAELKIAEATESFGYDFREKVVLDIGSSTGGFTEYALRCGARKVIAIEKGTNQMKTPLRFSSQVELYEKTDIFNVKNTYPDVILADVSFVSLTKILQHAKKYLARPETDFLVMLKPQFEAESQHLNKGVIKNEKIRREIIKNFESWLKTNEFLIIKKQDNRLAGRNGNIERFYWLKLSGRGGWI